MPIDRRNDNRRWKSIDDLWKEAFDDNIPALNVSEHPRGRDAFGRQRVSDPNTRLDTEFLYDKQKDFFDESVTNGTVTHNTATRDLTLALADANDGSFAKMSSYYVPYTPGNSQLVEITGVLDLAGIGGGQAESFIRTSISGSAVEHTTPQEQWASNKDGVDWSTAHIFVMDFQSLKVGTIRWGLFQDGVFQAINQVNNDNLRDSGYWQIASGAAYWKLYTTGGSTYMEVGYGNEANAIGFRYVITANASATMKAICCTVKSEGGSPLRELAGLSRTADSGVTPVDVGTTLIPVLSIRPQATYNSLPNLVLSIPKNWSVATTNPIKLVLIHDCTLTNASWVPANGTSTMEYDVSATAVAGGHSLDSEYIASSGSNRSGSASGLLGKVALWDRQDDVETGILTIAAIRTGTSNADVLASLSWEELR